MMVVHYKPGVTEDENYVAIERGYPQNTPLETEARDVAAPLRITSKHMWRERERDVLTLSPSVVSG
ncbi:hypothetical protein EYF80_051851 [Liparis tanakae]|uniref:Uncharacterized protein n=1 Tax=Liparis tanakae TaxID=230148 RepID=A0A4Z2F9T4_9TELE|nr:hypothetical protein EYF80_051851 [Liparis tanakae]